MGPFAFSTMLSLILDLCLLLLGVRGVGVSCGVVSRWGANARPMQHQEWQSLSGSPPFTSSLQGGHTRHLAEAVLRPDDRWMKENEVKRTQTERALSLTEAVSSPDTRRVNENEVKQTERTLLSEKSSARGLLSLCSHRLCRQKGAHRHSPVFTLLSKHRRRFSHFRTRTLTTQQQVHATALADGIKNSLHQLKRKRPLTTDGSMRKQISRSNLRVKRTAKRKNRIGNKKNRIGNKKNQQMQEGNSQKQTVKGIETEANENNSRNESSTNKPEKHATNKKQTADIRSNDTHSIDSRHRTRVTQAEKTASGSTTTSSTTRNSAHLSSSHNASSQSQQQAVKESSRQRHKLSSSVSGQTVDEGSSQAVKESSRQRKASSTISGRNVGDEEDTSTVNGRKQSSHSETQHTSLTTPESGVKSSKDLGLDGQPVNKTALLTMLRSRQQERRLQRDAMLAYVCVVVLVMLMILSLWCLGGMEACRYRPDEAVPFSDMQPLITVNDLLKSRRSYQLLYNEPEEWEEVLMCNRGSDP